MGTQLDLQFSALHPDLLPSGEPGRCKLCKSTDPQKCIAIFYKWPRLFDDVCACECHHELGGDVGKTGT
jgi:hypothetical protein